MARRGWQKNKKEGRSGAHPQFGSIRRFMALFSAQLSHPCRFRNNWHCCLQFCLIFVIAFYRTLWSLIRVFQHQNNAPTWPCIVEKVPSAYELHSVRMMNPATMKRGIFSDKSLSLMCTSPLPLFDFPPHPLLSGHFHISEGRVHFGTLVWSLCIWHSGFPVSQKLAKSWHLWLYTHVCQFLSDAYDPVANQCPTSAVSSFVPLVSELILSIPDVPFSPLGQDFRIIC